jgi:hypothetical protein
MVVSQILFVSEERLNPPAARRDQPNAEPDHSNFCRHPKKPVTPKGKYAHSERGNIFWFWDVETISARGN